MNPLFTTSLIRAEIQRFRHSGLWYSLMIPLGVGFLVQIAVPDSMAGDIAYEKRAFYCIIFSFWMGITNASRRIVGDRRVINRLILNGAGVGSIFLSKVAVIVLAALLHAAGFYTVFTLNVVDMTPTSRINSQINTWFYGIDNLHSWRNRDSAWHAANEDPFASNRDPNYNQKLLLGDMHDEAIKNPFGWFSPSDGEADLRRWFKFPGLLYALFLASAAAGVMGLALSAAFREGQTDRVLLSVPFLTAFQIMYAKVTTGGNAALFGPLDSISSVYEWYSVYHLLSFLSFSRYLIVISNYQHFIPALLSLDSIVIYVFMIIFAASTLVLLKRRETP